VNNDVGINYLQYPASHHHSFIGGLLAHSVDVVISLITENHI
jgi:23S rRNA maturation-related 3'-5' exoribonuclease YhaM